MLSKMQIFLFCASHGEPGSIFRNRFAWEGISSQPVSQASTTQPLLLGQSLALKDDAGRTDAAAATDRQDIFVSGGSNPGLEGSSLLAIFERQRARALGHGLKLLKNADTRHYTQFLKE
jgi:hypothetical protein